MWTWLKPNDADELLRQQLAEAKRDRTIHAASAEEHVAWVNMLDARIARIESELREADALAAGRAFMTEAQS